MMRCQSTRADLSFRELKKTYTILVDDGATVLSSTLLPEVVRIFGSLAANITGQVLQFLDVLHAHPCAKVMHDNFYSETQIHHVI